MSWDPPDGLPNGFTFPDLFKDRPAENHTAGFIAPHDEIFIDGAIIGAEILEAARVGSCGYSLGWTEYDDVFGRMHRTESATRLLFC